MTNGLTEQRVVGEPAEELAVVVVAGQHEAELREPGLGLGPQVEGSVASLTGSRHLGTVAGIDHRRQRPAVDSSCRVTSPSARERERIGPARA